MNFNAYALWRFNAKSLINKIFKTTIIITFFQPHILDKYINNKDIHFKIVPFQIIYLFKKYISV